MPGLPARDDRLCPRGQLLMTPTEPQGTSPEEGDSDRFGCGLIDDAMVTRAAAVLAEKLHWLNDRDRARELAKAALNAALYGRAIRGPLCPKCDAEMWRARRVTVGGRVPWRCMNGHLAVDDAEAARLAGCGYLPVVRPQAPVPDQPSPS